MRISDWSSDVCSSDLPSDARVQPRGIARPRPAARAVIDRAGASRPQKLWTDQLALRREGLFDPAVPGSRDRADDHDHRRAVARFLRSLGAPGVAAGLLPVVAVCGAGAGGTFHRQSAPPHRLPLWRPPTVRLTRAADTSPP